METPVQRKKTRKSMMGGSPTFLSPSVSSNKEQKDQMAHLNNRMAAYVEKVRSLEAENSTLKVQVEQYEEVSTSKTTKLKSIYEAELSEARRLLDETSKEKAQLALDKANYADKLNDATKENEELLSSNNKLQAELKKVHSSLQLKENFIATQSKDFEELKKSHDKLSSKLAALQQEYESCQQVLEKETLQRVDLENKIQSVREDLQFKERIHAEELTEARKVSTVTINEETFKAEYENKLEATINDLREQHEVDMEQYKDDVESAFQSKVSELQSSLEVSRSAIKTSNEQFTASKVEIDHLKVSMDKLQKEHAEVKSSNEELQRKVETQQEIHTAAIRQMEQERDETKETLSLLEKEYQELADIKVKLDGEISVYRKLLEEEETRLHMTPSPMQTRSKAKPRRKRKRVAVQDDVMFSASSSDAQEQQSAPVKRSRIEVQLEQRRTTKYQRYTNKTLNNENPEEQNSCAIM